MSEHMETEMLTATMALARGLGLKWLEKLHEEIWKEGPPVPVIPGKKRNPRRMEASRKLELTELEILPQVIQREGLVCEMINTRFGFGLGVRVMAPPPCPGAPPIHILTVSDEHLAVGAAWVPTEAHERWEAAWQTFSALTHTDANVKLAEFCGIEAPQPRQHYEW
jgi:hypothetical protein